MRSFLSLRDYTSDLIKDSDIFVSIFYAEYYLPPNVTASLKISQCRTQQYENTVRDWSELRRFRSWSKFHSEISTNSLHTVRHEQSNVLVGLLDATNKQLCSVA